MTLRNDGACATQTSASRTIVSTGTFIWWKRTVRSSLSIDGPRRAPVFFLTELYFTHGRIVTLEEEQFARVGTDDEHRLVELRNVGIVGDIG